MSLSVPTTSLASAVIELRQYTLVPGQRDAFVDFFERHFIESQDAAGAKVIGQFRDRDRDDRFVWLRGFPDMPSRQAALERFYGGPVWTAHRDEANRAMLEFDDVLLLKPARPDLALCPGSRRAAPARPPGRTVVVAGIHALAREADDTIVARFEQQVLPHLREAGIHVEGVYVTESSPNTFPRLPVRDGEWVLVWFGTRDRASGSLGDAPGLLARLEHAFESEPARLPVILDLDPTPQSRLGGSPASSPVQGDAAGAHDFDFLDGAWTVHNRFLVERLRGSSAWIEFDARFDFERRLGGLGNIDRFVAVRDGVTIEGLSLRLFDPATGLWSIYWADTVRPGLLLPPMIGRFTDGDGEFFGEETADGRTVPCRFHWTGARTASPRWEQAFSDDGGRTWETNWIMTFRRP